MLVELIVLVEDYQHGTVAWFGLFYPPMITVLVIVVWISA
jgi:hypothetical protein